VLDFMGFSYCVNPTFWTSPYRYLNFKNNIVSTFGSGAASGATSASGGRSSVWNADEAEFGHLQFRLYRGGRVELRSAFHLLRRPPPRPTGDVSEVRLELWSADETFLSTEPLQTFDGHLPDEMPFNDFVGAFPFPSELASVRVVQGGRELGRFQVASEPPSVTIERSDVRDDTLHVHWKARAAADAQPALAFGIRYSADGKRWRALAVGLKEHSFQVDLSLLPGGEECRVQVVAYAGFRTATATTPPFVRETTRRRAYIGSPRSGTELRVGELVHLVGAGHSPSHGATCADDVTWYTTELGALGRGHQLSVELPVGRHRITLHAPDGAGGEATASVDVSVVAKKDCGCMEPGKRAAGHRCSHCGH
jgi:hypothetical protein